MQKEIPVLIIAAVAVAGVVLGHHWAKRDVKKPPKVSTLKAPTRGATKPLVELVVFGRLNLRWSARATVLALRAVREFPTEVRLRYHISVRAIPGNLSKETRKRIELQYHRTLAKGAFAAHLQGKFWSFITWVYGFNSDIDPHYKAKQRVSLGAKSDALKQVEKWVKHNRLDWKSFKNDMNSKAVARYLDVESTRVAAIGPIREHHIVVNGTVLDVRFHNYRRLKSVLLKELARLRKKSKKVSRFKRRMNQTAKNLRGKPFRSFFLSYVARDRHPEHPVEPLPIKRPKPVHVPVLPESDFVLGPKYSPVTLVVFSDYNCPHCSKASISLARLREVFPDSLRVVPKFFPTPTNVRSVTAAMAALAAGQQGKFWAYQNRLYQTRTTWNGIARNVDLYFVRLAGKLGLDTKRFAADIRSPILRRRISVDLDLARRLGLSGTPILFINGMKISHYPYTKLLRWVNAERKRGRRLLASGVSRKSLYERLTGGMKNLPGVPKRLLVTSKKSGPRPSLISKTTFRVEVGTNEPMLGPPNALVTLVHFLDLSRAASRLALSNLIQLQQRNPADVRVVVRQGPRDSHTDSMTMARTLLAAHRQKRFWPLVKRLVTLKRVDMPILHRELKRFGLDRDRLKRDLKGMEVNSRIDLDLLASLRAGTTYDLRSYMNGRRMARTGPLFQLLPVIQWALADARARVKRGTKRGLFYASLIKDGKQVQVTRLSKVRHKIPVDNSVIRGKADSPVTITLFTDLVRKRDVEFWPELEAFIKQYPGRIRLVVKHRPDARRKRAESAALAALAARSQKKYWDYRLTLIANRGKLSAENLEQYAKDNEMNLEAFRKALTGDLAKQQLEREKQLAIKLGVTSTPTLFINGRRFISQAGLKIYLVRHLSQRWLK